MFSLLSACVEASCLQQLLAVQDVALPSAGRFNPAAVHSGALALCTAAKVAVSSCSKEASRGAPRRVAGYCSGFVSLQRALPFLH